MAIFFCKVSRRKNKSLEESDGKTGFYNIMPSQERHLVLFPVTRGTAG